MKKILVIVGVVIALCVALAAVLVSGVAFMVFALNWAY